MDMNYITRDSVEIMRWFAWLKVIFMWFGILCAILIPLLIVAFQMMFDSDPPTAVEKLSSPNGKIVAIIADWSNPFSGSIMRHIYIGPSHMAYPKNIGHYHLVMKGGGYGLHWENDQTLIVRRIHEGSISEFNPLIYLSENPKEPILVKLESSFNSWPRVATPTATPPFNPGDAQ